ncbi:MAG: GspE/PulE family protein [Actinomycetota bacterium]
MATAARARRASQPSTRTRAEALASFNDALADLLAESDDDTVDARAPFAPEQSEAPLLEIPPVTRWAGPAPVETCPDGAPNAGAAHPQLPLIGETLVERGLVTERDIASAVELQRATHRRIGQTLVEMGVLSSVALTEVIAERVGFPFVDLSSQQIDQKLATLIPDHLARNHGAIPIGRQGKCLVVAMADPEDVFALDDLRVVTGHSVRAVMADRMQLKDVIERTWNRQDVENQFDEAGEVEDENPASAQSDVENAPIVRLVNALLLEAVNESASDIHVEPLSDGIRIRMRVDGVLRDASETPTSVLRPLVSRIKVLGGIDITRRRVPHDGRFSTTIDGREIDVRVATLPTAHGEAVVLRLLDRVRTVLELPTLGLSGLDLVRYEEAIRSPQGSVIVSGPTGSGKTSTLYATLAALNAPDRSIVSVEDPIEYRLDGIKQIQVDIRAGVTFPSALRSILRADPDVVFVGEIRDSETAKIASEAAITGHLVLSTIHTLRAAAVPMRLIEMGVEPYLVVSSLSCVVAQRLVRKLCERCAVLTDVDERNLIQLGCPEALLENATMRRAVGCPTCRTTGYRGRGALYEVMEFSEEIARLVLTGASRHEIEASAIAGGMESLRIAALRRVVSGQLSIDEMLRVVAR